MKKWLAWVGIVIFNLIIVLGSLEGILRLFPQWMPYAQKWNYRHHYAQMYALVSNPNYIQTLNPDILLIGDSFTRGAEVPFGKDWGTLLQKSFQETFFNLGIGGSSTVEQAILLARIPPSSNTKIVILNLYAGDINQNIVDAERFQKEGEQPFLKRIFLTVKGGRLPLECRGLQWYQSVHCYFFNFYSIATVFNLYAKWQLRDEFLPEIQDASQYHFISDGKFYISKETNVSHFASQKQFEEHFQRGIRITLGAVKNFIDYCKVKNLKLLVTYFPSQTEVYVEELGKATGQTVVSLSLGATLKPYFEQINIPFLDMTPRFREAKFREAPIFLKYDNHMTMKGHQLAAEWISWFLKQHL